MLWDPMTTKIIPGVGDRWTYQTVWIVNSERQCSDAADKILNHCLEYNVIAIGCDFGQKINLLTLATNRGFCALVRIALLQTIPQPLKRILEDKSIVKVGYDVAGLSKKLMQNKVHVESILDERFIAQNYLGPNIRDGAAIHMVETRKRLLKIDLKERHRMNSINWSHEAALERNDVKFAANDIQATIELFKKIQLETTQDLRAFIGDNCVPFLNQVYRRLRTGAALQPQAQQAGGSGQLMGDQEVHFINSVADYGRIAKKLREHINEYKVIAVGHVAQHDTLCLLKLATHRGLCVLIQIRKLREIPIDLKEILENKNIIKIGEVVAACVQRLKVEYGVKLAGELDIKTLATACNHPIGEVIELAKIHLNQNLETRDWRLLHTDWKYLETFSLDQLNYAASLVYATMKLFAFFEVQLLSEKYSFDRAKFIADISDGCYASRKMRIAIENQRSATLPRQDIRLISNEVDFSSVANTLQSHIDEYPIIGFDCETRASGRNKIALLQLATHRGLCVLIRMCKFRVIPPDLRRIMRDENILKVGVMPHNDAKQLLIDYGLRVNEAFDLRHLARHCRCWGTDLGNLTEELLNVTLDHKVRGLNTRELHRKWECDPLPEENIKYAANDAHAAIELFKKFQEKIMPESLECGVQHFVNVHCTRPPF